MVVFCFAFFSFFVEINQKEQADDNEMIPGAILNPPFTSVQSLANPTFILTYLETADLSK